MIDYWVRLSKEKPLAAGMYSVWCLDALCLDWNGDNFVDRYGIPHRVISWMRKQRKPKCPDCQKSNYSEGSLLEHLTTHIPFFEKIWINVVIWIQETWYMIKRS